VDHGFPQEDAGQGAGRRFDRSPGGRCPAARHDDPIFAPIEGISLEEYARIAKIGANQGVTDEAGMNAIAVAEGHDAAAWGAAVKGWVDRMGQNMAIGQNFRKYYDAAG